MISDKDRLGFTLLGACILLITALAIGALVLEHHQAHFNASTGCVEGTGPSGEVVALLDLSDSVSLGQQAEILKYFQQLAETGLPANTRLTIWTLSGDRAGTLQRRFSRCRPSSAVNLLIQNEEQAAARVESLFTLPLSRALQELPVHETATATPLLAAVKQVGEQPEFNRAGVAKRLVLVSNLEENSSVFSVYRGLPSFVAFHASAAYVRVAADLRGVDVEVLYMPHGRAAITLSDELTTFWSEYFHACGARSVEVRRL